MLQYLRAWLSERFDLDEKGAAATEYVLLILGVVLFMIVAAFGLRDVLSAAVGRIGSWISAVNAPAPPTP